MNKTQTAAYELVEQEKQPGQLTWLIQVDGTAIGTVGIILAETDELEAPAVHIAIDDVQHREGSIAAAVIKDMVSYAYRTIPSEYLYSRYLLADATTEQALKSLGFEKDNDPYTDDDGQKWQNTILVV